jgi:carboxyl-terminal processing protease
MGAKARLAAAGALGAVVVALVAASAAPKEPGTAKERDRWEPGDYDSWRNRPHETFGDGAAMLELVKQTLLEKYVDAGLTEDDLYRAAVQGMLANLDPDKAAWNRLMTPSEHAELMSDKRGEIVGLGVEVDFDETSGSAIVLGVFPGTPSAQAGIGKGDQILRVDGKGFKGKQLRDVVYAIRGATGSTVRLSVLHDAEVRELTLKRSAVVWDTVSSVDAGDGIHVVSIRYFTDTTPRLLQKTLDELAAKKPRGVVVDLRGNEGGLFDRAIDCIRMLVAKDLPIVDVVKRGDVEERLVGTAAPVLGDVPMVVLIDAHSKSSAEIMAGALHASAGATLVGAPSFGKWSLQRVEELPNKFAIKFTIGTFRTPSTPKDGGGLVPEIFVELPDGVADRALRLPTMAERLAADPQLQTAVNVLKLRD